MLKPRRLVRRQGFLGTQTLEKRKMSVLKILASLVRLRKPGDRKKIPQVIDPILLTGHQWLNLPIEKGAK